MAKAVLQLAHQSQTLDCEKSVDSTREEDESKLLSKPDLGPDAPETDLTMQKNPLSIETESETTVKAKAA